MVRWRARLQRSVRFPPASALNGGDAVGAGLVPGADPALGHGPDRRPGLVRRRDHQDRRDDHDQQPYDGATLTLFDKTDGLQPAFAIVDGKVAVAGDLVSVKAAIDTKGNGGFAKEPGPKAALDSIDGDHVGFAYVALRPLLDWSTELTQGAGRIGGGTAARRSAPRSTRRSRTGAPTGSGSRTTRSSWRPRRPSRRRASARPRTARSTVAEHIPATRSSRPSSNDLGDDPQAGARRCIASRAVVQAGHRPGRPGARPHRRGGCRVRLGRRQRGRHQRRGRDARGRPARDRPDRQGRRRAPVHRAPLVHRDRWRPAGHHRHATRPTTAPRSPSSTSATSPSSTGMVGDGATGARHAGPADGARPDRLRGDRPGRRDRLRPGLRQARPRHDQGHLARLERSLHERSPTAPATGTGSTFVDIARHPRPDREGGHRVRGRPGRHRQVPDRRQAVPRPVRRAVRVELDPANDLSRSVIYVTVK